MLRGQNHNSKAVTLTELLIAISLLGFVILGITVVDLFTRRQLQGSSIRANILNEISPAMEHIVKNICQGIGDINNPGINTSSIEGDRAIRVRIDRNNTPANYNDDTWVAYRYRSESAPLSDRYQIWYCDNCTDSRCTICNPSWGSEVIAYKVTDLTFSLIDSNNDDKVDDKDVLLLQINMTAREDPTLSADTITNPEISLNSRVQLRSSSIR